MIARLKHLMFSLAALAAVAGGDRIALACDHCNGHGGRSYSSFAHADYGYGHDGGCSSCGMARCRDASCYNVPNPCRHCPPNPDKVDCCNPCSRKRVFGCGWRTWDLLGYWTCGSGCGDCAGCGEIYRGDYASDPPACCDPCDGYGNWIGPGAGYRAPYHHGHYVGGEYYEPTYDYTYAGGESYREPGRIGSVVRSQPAAAPSRLVPSSTAKAKAKVTRQAWQVPRNMQR